jgi:oligopeptide transport system permease protein
MTALPADTALEIPPAAGRAAAPDDVWQRLMKSGRGVVGGGVILIVLVACVVSLAWTANPTSTLYFDHQDDARSLAPPDAGSPRDWFGTDKQGRGILGRCLFGGVISLAIGMAAATISVILGVTVGLVAGYRGGWVDATLMRLVDILYGLPYVLLLILFKIALEGPLTGLFVRLQSQYVRFNPRGAASVVVLFLAIGLVSWLTMARVVRGQVLSLRAQPFIEAARAAGLKERRIFLHHLLPNLVGPIIVYATLTIPQAILQESFLSFLGVGIQPPLPTWGSLASDALLPALNPVNSRWWLLVFPCTLLAATLLSLNFLGDGLRDVLDPKRDAGKL